MVGSGSTVLKTPSAPFTLGNPPNQEGTLQQQGAVGFASNLMFCGFDHPYLSVLVPEVGLVQAPDYFRYTTNGKWKSKCKCPRVIFFTLHIQWTSHVLISVASERLTKPLLTR